MSFLGQPLNGVATRWPYGFCKNPVIAPGAADALPVTDADVLVTTAGVNAMTLAAPKAGVYPAGSTKLQSLGDPQDDGKVLRVILTTAQIHTITTPANKLNGSLHIVTFTAVVGNFVVFYAFNGIWYVLDSKGATLT
jgi:hypothetical protein